MVPIASLTIGCNRYDFIDLPAIFSSAGLPRLPYSIRLLLENVARCTPDALPTLLESIQDNGPLREVPFFPNRMMFHDTTCLPALADFAGIRDRVAELGGNPADMQPVIPTVLAIDHSIVVEHYRKKDAAAKNLAIDFRRNRERYQFIKWAQKSLDDFRVVPPGTGIIHQLNMESLSPVVCRGLTTDGKPLLHMDNMVATDSHTPMINALGVLAWGIGGIEALAAMLGEPIFIPFPKVVGIRLINHLPSEVTATDLALKLTQILRAEKVVGKFIEFYGPGLKTTSLGTRGTLANMAPEYGATVVFFPFDDITMNYLSLTGRSPEQLAYIEAYLQAQGLWRKDDMDEAEYNSVIELDLATIERCAAGPSQPHQWRKLADVGNAFEKALLKDGRAPQNRSEKELDTFHDSSFGTRLTHGTISIAAITSCTNTANPHQVIQAGLLARNAKACGLKAKPWVKTTFTPGSKVVAAYLNEADLLADFSALGFDLAGFGCMTCIGNSGPLEPRMDVLADQGLKTVAVLSGNRNFEGRVHPKIQHAYLVSPALVVAYALTGVIHTNIQKESLGTDHDGKPVYLKELMPSNVEVQQCVDRVVRPKLFEQHTANIWEGTHHWQDIVADGSIRFPWDLGSTYLRRPIYTKDIARSSQKIQSRLKARALMVLGDNVTTDHISPASAIPVDSPAGRWLLDHGELPEDLNQYSTRRSNHEVMMRGAFINKAVRNRLLQTQPGPGGWAYAADGSVKPVFEAAMTYLEQDIPLVIIAGVNYGAGSSRDWAAKSQATLGVKVVVARSFERIHRSNLIGMGVFPIEFPSGVTADSLNINGSEILLFEGLEDLKVGGNLVMLSWKGDDNREARCKLALRIDSSQEIHYLNHGGILPYITRKVAG